MISSSKFSISVVIPVYNEEEIIEQCIINTFDSLSSLFLDYELIIINDGSLDQTPQILSNLSKLYSQLHIITNTKNLGIGKSLLKGLKFAKKECIVHIFRPLQGTASRALFPHTQWCRHLEASKQFPQTPVSGVERVRRFRSCFSCDKYSSSPVLTASQYRLRAFQ